MQKREEPCVTAVKCHPELNPRDLEVSSTSTALHTLFSAGNGGNRQATQKGCDRTGRHVFVRHSRAAKRFRPFECVKKKNHKTFEPSQPISKDSIFKNRTFFGVLFYSRKCSKMELL